MAVQFPSTPFPVTIVTSPLDAEYFGLSAPTCDVGTMEKLRTTDRPVEIVPPLSVSVLVNVPVTNR